MESDLKKEVYTTINQMDLAIEMHSLGMIDKNTYEYQMQRLTNAYAALRQQIPGYKLDTFFKVGPSNSHSSDVLPDGQRYLGVQVPIEKRATGWQQL
jgi:hypothetical protein